MKKNFIYLFLILALAFILRFWQLGQVPHGMTWDEAAIGYNGFAVRTVYRDEWLKLLPISFRSFGDYKAPFAIYLSGIFTWVFGLNLFAIRLPFALAGLMAVLAIYLLTKEIFHKNKKRELLALASAFILTVSPWHIHYSRLGFESGLALSILIWAAYFLFFYIRKEKKWALFFGAALASLTLYTYHSAKVTVPLLILFLIVSNWKFFQKRIKDLVLVSIFSLLLLSPLAYDSFLGDGLTRVNTSIFMQDLSFGQLVLKLLENFLSYFSPAFLVFGENAGQFRHSDGKFGILNPASLLMILFYLSYLLFKKVRREKVFIKKDQKIFQLALVWILLGLLPAIITEGKFHNNRAFLALPGYILLTVLSGKLIHQLIKFNTKKFVLLFVSLYLFFTASYQINYYNNYADLSVDAFNDGYIETFEYIKDLDKSNIEKILFTNDYQEAQIYALLVNELSPYAYHGGILSKFEFTNKTDEGDLFRKNAIVVASKYDDMKGEEPDHIIKGSNGEDRFFIYLTQEK